MASEDLLKKAVAAFNALSPEQQAEMLEEQRQSWARGNVGLSRDERGMTSPVMPRPPTVMASEYCKFPHCECSMGAAERCKRIRTRPAPAATDTGLETIGRKERSPHGVHFLADLPEGTELVTRQNAEAVIGNLKNKVAAKDKLIQSLIDFDSEEVKRLEADNAAKDREIESITKRLIIEEQLNAAKDARIKELEKLCSNMEAEALGYASDPVVQARFETVDDGIIGTRFVDVKRVEQEDDDSLTVVIDYWPTPSPEATTLRAENKRLREALDMSEAAISEYYRYRYGGELRGSYDGKPEREGLWKAMYKARAALGKVKP